MRSMRLQFVVAAVAAFPAAAFAGDLNVPRDYPTIGAALDAAHAGDRIVVRGGSYADVTISKDDVTLVGRGATLTGAPRIDGARVTLRGFRIAGGSQMTVTGDDATLADNRLLRDRTIGFSIIHVDGGARVRIEGNRGRWGGVEIQSGKGATVRANRIQQSWINVSDDAAVVEGNSSRSLDIQMAGRGHTIRRNHTRVLFVVDRAGGVVGDSTIEDNTVWRFESEGDRNVVQRNVITESMYVGGDDVSVISNTLPRTAMGILVRGSRATVSKNVIDASTVYNSTPDCPNMRMRPADMYGIHVVAPEPGGVIEGNRITHENGLGLVLEVSGATVRGNTVEGSSSLTSIAVVGSGNAVTGNAVTQSGRETATGNGIDVTGDTNSISDNHVAGTSADGVAVQSGSGNTITNNVVEASRGCGILIGDGAVGTAVSDCTVTGGPLGLVNLGAGTSIGDSTLMNNGRADVLDLGAISGVQLLGGNTLGTLSHNAGLLSKR